MLGFSCQTNMCLAKVAQSCRRSEHEGVCLSVSLSLATCFNAVVYPSFQVQLIVYKCLRHAAALMQGVINQTNLFLIKSSKLHWTEISGLDHSKQKYRTQTTHQSVMKKVKINSLPYTIGYTEVLQRWITQLCCKN